MVEAEERGLDVCLCVFVQPNLLLSNNTMTLNKIWGPQNDIEPIDHAKSTPHDDASRESVK